RSLSQATQVSKAVNTGAVPIGPARSQRITAHDIESGEMKTFRRIRYVRSHDVPDHIRLTAARRARAGAAKKLQIKIRFDAVIPNNCKLIAYLLDVRWLQTHDIDPSTLKHGVTRAVVS